MKSLKYLFFGSRTVTQERKKELLDFCKPLGLKFNDIELLDLAFHHRSYSNEHSQHKRYNEAIVSSGGLQHEPSGISNRFRSG